MPKLKVAVDVTPILPGGACGGAKPFVLELLRGLTARRAQGTFELLTAPRNHDEFGEFDAPGVTRRLVDGLVAPIGLRRLGFDLLFCPMTAPTFAERGVATVCTLYDLQHLDHPWFFSNAEITHRNRFYHELVARADHVVCISEFSRRRLIEHLPIPAERTSAVPITIHQRLQSLPVDDAWQILAGRGLAPCRFGFYPANFWPHKNHRMLLVAFARFLAECPESDLHVVLTGELLDEGAFLAASIRHMGLAGRVHVLGFVSDREMSALWNVAAFLVYPSLYEGFGIPVREAMHFTKPVLCSREGSLPEVGGDDVIYFNARDPRTIVDAFRRTMLDADALRAQALVAHDRLSRLDPLTAVDRYASVFEQVVAARRQRRRSLAEDAERIIWPLRDTLIDRRRASGTALMRSGRDAMRLRRLASGTGRALAGACLAPDVAGPAMFKPVFGRALNRVRRHPLVKRWIVPDATKMWLRHHTLHGDGWAGPTLVIELDIESQHTQVRLEGTGAPGRLKRSLRLKAFLNGTPLGSREIGRVDRFSVTWLLRHVSAGRHTFRVVANEFLVADAVLNNGDFRPLSYRVTELRAEEG